MATTSIPVLGFIWAQFSAYHVDRLEAAGRKLQGRARVLAIEVAPASHTYAWEESLDVQCTEKTRFFQNVAYEDIPAIRRFWRQLRALSRCDTVFIGIPYSTPEIIVMVCLLRLMGKTVVMMSASKFDDFPRSTLREFGKRILLSAYSAAIVGGVRQYEYARFLGFNKRRVLPGYNTVSMKRVRDEATKSSAGMAAFADRPFIYVGRFVAKKNIEAIIKGYASYAARKGSRARRFSLIGSGALQEQLASQCQELGVAHLVDFKGFLTAREVAAELADGLALVLVSIEEQWGLVINEALAVGLPVIASPQVGAREALVRNLVNGYVVEPRSVEAIAMAFERMDCAEGKWQEMSSQSSSRAWLADAERFADAVELMVFPQLKATAAAHQDFETNILIQRQS